MILEVTNDTQSVTMHLHSLTTNLMQTQASVIELQHTVQVWSILSMVQSILLMLAIFAFVYLSNVVKRVTTITHRILDMNGQLMKVANETILESQSKED
jgi:hypothetical protein